VEAGEGRRKWRGNTDDGVQANVNAANEENTSRMFVCKHAAKSSYLSSQQLSDREKRSESKVEMIRDDLNIA